MKKETDRRAFTLIQLPVVRKGETKGFTLIELLVVIAIIVLLIALLVPNMSGVLRWARTHQCARNLHEIGKAVASHKSSTGTIAAAAWPAAVLPILDNQAQILICPETDEGEVLENYTPLVDMGQMRFSNGNLSPLGEEVWVAKLSQTQHTAARAAGLLSGADSANNWDPWPYEPDENPHIYWFCYEDLRGGDADFKDIMLKVTETGGSAVITFWRGGVTGVGSELEDFEVGVVRTLGTWPNDNTLQQQTSVEPYSFNTGGTTTYGMNKNAGDLSGGTPKILAVDFNMVVVDTDAGAWDPNPPFARHGGKMNALYMDGSVKLRSPDDIDPAAATVADQHWRP
jgi:prepilin-type N-terminal cleavage/methylation domain-containing protein/prepilin-type processing-associated H-X9-DG protein